MRADVFNLFLFNWLQFPIGKTSPQPFKGTKSEIPEPNMAENNLKYPNCQDHKIQLITLQSAEHSKAYPIKNNSTYNGLHQVIGESHLPYWSHQIEQPFKPS